MLLCQRNFPDKRRLPFPTPGNLLNPRIEPTSLESPALAGGFFTTESPGKPQRCIWKVKICKIDKNTCEKNKAKGISLPSLKTLHNYLNWEYVVLVEDGQTCRSMEQYKELRNTTKQISPVGF